jgi:hypothetical protein
MTLRSGKAIEKPILEPCEKDDESIPEGKEELKDDESIPKGKEEVKPEYCKEITNSLRILPVSHIMTNQRKVNQNSKIFETFK